MTFAQLNLDQDISKAIALCGYTEPTPVQARCIPEILDGKDLVASAQTGTGKTAAFVLPALHRLARMERTGSKKPRVLILTPTRELASQITQAAQQYGKFLRFNIISLVGGMPYRQQLKDLSRPVDIIVATPGRLLDHMGSRRVDLSEIEMLVLDEADRMLDMGFIDDVKEISKKTPANRQTLLFSATVDDSLSGVIRQLLKNPVRIDLANQKVTSAQIKQELYLTDSTQHKNRLLQHFLENGNIFKAIIFSGTKLNADKLANTLCDQGYPAAALHGDLRQNVRNRTIEQLRRGKIQFLVATDVAARGIDIADITHVFNYDLPRFPEDYVHRIGRTGRAGKTGIAISFALPTDRRHLDKLKRSTGQQLHAQVIPGLEPTQASYGAAPKSKKRGGGFGGKKFIGEKEFSNSRKAGATGGRPDQADKKSFGRKFTGEKKFSADKESFGRKFGGEKKFSADKESFGRKFGGEKKFSADKESFGRKFGGEKKFSADKEFSGRKFGGEKKFSADKESFGRKFGGEKKFSADKESFGRKFKVGATGGRPDRANKEESFGRRRSRDDKPFSADKESFGGRRSRGEKKFSADKESFGGRKFGGEKKFSVGKEFAGRKFGGKKKFAGDRKSAR